MSSGRYGETKAFYKIHDGELSTYYKEIETRPCTKSELHLNEKDDSNKTEKLWDYDSSIKVGIEAYSDRFMCFDDNIKIKGAYQHWFY